MTQSPPNLTDRSQLDRNRKRATEGGMFLHELVAADLHDRLTMVNREFTKLAIVTGFPKFWAKRFPNAQVVRDEDVLDLTPNTYDLVIHAMALHWANDPVGQLIQCARALQPDGLFLASCFGGTTLAELRAVLAETEASLLGGISPRIAPMGEIRDMGALLQRAGFALPVADSAPRAVTYADSYALMRDLRQMGEGNALEARERRILSPRFFNHVAETYAMHFPADDDRITATFEIITLTGWAPDPSQQKPLRPGSAAARLADALGTDETNLSD